MIDGEIKVPQNCRRPRQDQGWTNFSHTYYTDDPHATRGWGGVKEAVWGKARRQPAREPSPIHQKWPQRGRE